VGWRKSAKPAKDACSCSVRCRIGKGPSNSYRLMQLMKLQEFNMQLTQ
jgi:hypothetical protein